MTHKNKKLLAALLALSMLAISSPALASGKSGKHGRHHINPPNYGWNDNRHNGNRWDNRGYGGGKQYKYNYNRYRFDTHVPRHLRYSRATLPVMIVIDSSGNYRGQSAARFFQTKAAREGFILAYTYDRGYKGRYLSRQDKDAIVRSVLNMLDGHYRVDTRRINFYFN